MSTLVNFLADHKIEYREYGDHGHCTEGFVNVDCSNCSPDSGHFRLGISLTSLAANCWVCGRTNTGQALGQTLGIPSKVCWGKLGAVVRQGFSHKARGKVKLPTGVGPLLPAHERYLKSRGFDAEELVSLWGLQGTAQASTLPWRIIIPVTLNGQVVSWSSRQLHDRGKRYHSAGPEEEAVNHKTLLWGEQYVGNAVLVCEGFFDAMRVGPGVVATMGLTVTPEQVRRLSRVYRRVIVFDNEAAAQSRAHKLAEQLSLFPGEVINVQLDGKDPASSSEQEINLLREYLR